MMNFELLGLSKPVLRAIAELGFEELFYGDSVCVAEWSERLTELLPPDVLSILFEYAGDDRRMITMTSSGQKSDALLEQLQDELQNKKIFDQTGGYLV